MVNFDRDTGASCDENMSQAPNRNPEDPVSRISQKHARDFQKHLELKITSGQSCGRERSAVFFEVVLFGRVARDNDAIIDGSSPMIAA